MELVRRANGARKVARAPQRPLARQGDKARSEARTVRVRLTVSAPRSGACLLSPQTFACFSLRYRYFLSVSALYDEEIRPTQNRRTLPNVARTTLLICSFLVSVSIL